LLAVLVLACTASVAFAQDSPYPNPRPMFFAGSRPATTTDTPPAGNLVQWNGSFTDLTHNKRTFVMVGTDPSKTNVTSTVQAWIIPVKFVFDKNHGNKTFDPKHKLSNGQTVIQNITTSPLFVSGIDFKQGATDLGKTQYIDAFQRGTWWGKNVKKNNKYHVLLKPVVKPEQTINCTDTSCRVGNEFGVTVGLADINFYDNQVQSFMNKLGATPDILPVFIFYDTYLTSGGCCIGGYHFVNGGPPNGQTYSNAAYVDKVGAFSQDVSRCRNLNSRNGRTTCSSARTQSVARITANWKLATRWRVSANFGGFKYKPHGFTYNLQSLVFVGYCDPPRSESANKWLIFQNEEKNVCPGQ
jgi:hypothetical protein